MGSGESSRDPSSSDGWDSCLAAAWRTRFCTSEDEGDVGRPSPLVSSFPAAHENACAPSLTGTSNRLRKGQKGYEHGGVVSPQKHQCVWDYIANISLGSIWTKHP